MATSIATSTSSSPYLCKLPRHMRASANLGELLLPPQPAGGCKMAFYGPHLADSLASARR
eukprot:scaffold165928_cov23-Tisochrysis_lutea.AAC.1